jgi:hypothetical protein
MIASVRYFGEGRHPHRPQAQPGHIQPAQRHLSVVMFGGLAVIAPPFVPFPPPAPLALLLRSSPDWWLLTLDPRVGKGR